MSGGVGTIPTSPNEQIHKQNADDSLSSSLTKPHNPPTLRRRFLSFRQLNALAAIIVLSASGMVPASDVIFSFFSLIYIHFLSLFSFPPSPHHHPQSIFSDDNLLLSLYLSAGALIGLFLPILYIFEGVVEGDKHGIQGAAPHLFLLSCQVFMEGVTFSRRFSLPMRMFVQVMYNGRRLFTVAEWVRREVKKVEEGEEEYGSGLRLMVGRGLAMVNMGFWMFNLFGFLLPVCLPRALKMYYGVGEKMKV
ncbi:uncharacterized protein LOC120274703 [Dioscorea cayenensis subsp. rotundata]|uniref:Uncharacterized protein LOC120274703 n=1 Tax=Dioscorea cayennensis subsp. rotundata TaxID=55577 RepID=A0AB40CCR6_DIOCR|nr:uncharacterized protein LOC120274703 [Dioscorea cayenensis subsp. rotundata]